MPPETLIEVRLVAIRRAARDTHLYEFEAVNGARLPDAEPGAHIDVHLPNQLMRQYSLIRAQANPASYVIGVKRDLHSRGGSRFMHEELRVGTTLKIAAPRNNFPLAATSDRSVLFAGGIGITPIWAMIQQLTALRRSWELHYSCRSRADAAFLGDLMALDQVHCHFDDEHAGRVLDLASPIARAPRNAHLYCCGPAAMLKSFEALTENWPREQIHVEYFTAKEPAARGGGFTVELARSGLELPVPEGKTILQVLIEAGIDVASSCEEGVCGACETRVVAGAPDHRDAVLSPAERAANNRMMICCSGSKSSRLVLDL